eukprot:15457011-Alexandrium_andersonii.AAC.1
MELLPPLPPPPRDPDRTERGSEERWRTELPRTKSTPGDLPVRGVHASSPTLYELHALRLRWTWNVWLPMLRKDV